MRAPRVPNRSIAFPFKLWAWSESVRHPTTSLVWHAYLSFANLFYDSRNEDRTTKPIPAIRKDTILKRAKRRGMEPTRGYLGCIRAENAHLLTGYGTSGKWIRSLLGGYGTPLSLLRGWNASRNRSARWVARNVRYTFYDSIGTTMSGRHRVAE